MCAVLNDMYFYKAQQQGPLSTLLTPVDAQAAAMSDHVELYNDSGRVPSEIDPPVGTLYENEDHCQ
jgi:hypothetical protein